MWIIVAAAVYFLSYRPTLAYAGGRAALRMVKRKPNWMVPGWSLFPFSAKKKTCCREGRPLSPLNQWELFLFWTEMSL